MSIWQGLCRPVRHYLNHHSLAGRLRLASCLLLPLILGVTALILDQAFRSSLETATRERLKLQTYVLLGAAEAGGGQLWMPATLQEPRFSQPGSGLYGLVSDDQGQLLWRSPSTLDGDLSRESRVLPNNTQEKPQFGRTALGLFFFSYPVVWETEDGRETPFLFATLERPTAFDAELNSFRFHLWGGLGLLALLLLLAQGLILRWGLAPLMQMAEDLKAIETGNSEQLSGRYPREVVPVTTNLNQLLEGQRRQRERYRNTLSDLAHSLKTPLAVIRNTGDDDSLSGIAEQVDRMDQIISHQLGRASTTSPHHLLKPVPIGPVAERIGNALKKVYGDRLQEFQIEGESSNFKGDERDLMEILGNLIDNACKYGDGRVAVRLQSEDGHILIRVEDNGPGISPDLHDVILQRGTRVDNQEQGQGIGLSVVRDILSGYRGTLAIGESPLGGAAFIIRLPG